MGDFPVDENPDGFPISPDSSSLDLYEFSSTSQIFTPSQLTFTWSSSDIPFVLYDEAYAEESTPILPDVCVNDATTPQMDGCLSVTGSRRISGTMRFPTESDSIALKSSESSKTICSIGTFGSPTQDASDMEVPWSPGSESLPQGSTQIQVWTQTFISVENSTRRGSISIDNRRLSDERRYSTQRSAGAPADDSLSVPIEDRHSTASSSTIAALACESTSIESESSTLDASSLFGFETGSVTITPKAIPEALSWISTRGWNPQQYKDFVAREDLSRLPTTTSETVDDEILSQQNSLIRPRTFNKVDVNTNDSENRRIRGEIDQPKRRANLAPPLPIQDHREIDWPMGMTVQLIMDQEGFRAAEPCFKFSGITRRRSSPEVLSPDICMAQFRPVTRQTFHFHCAPWETPPILRRITVNNDETYDYISRQAYLTLKSNGVYVVLGHEIFSADHTAESTKLHWQFEYLVDDRCLDTVTSTSRAVEDEKTLTPLTFSCSPELMLQAHAKKINIMHILKKGVAPKIVAEKLQPPGTARNQIYMAGDAVPSADLGARKSNFFVSKAHTWNIHGRNRSRGIRQSDIQHATTTPPSVSGRGHHVVQHARSAEQKNGRHRRASSAGESHPAAVGSTPINSRRRRDSSAAHNSPVQHLSRVRHIIPPAQLVELLDLPSKNSPPITPEFWQSTIPDRGNNAFLALSPRPRHVR